MKTPDVKGSESVSNIGFRLLDLGFHVLHLSIIGFFLVGWLFDATLPAHFMLCLLILLSWFGLGWFKGFGYCLVTDLQWKVKRHLQGEPATEFYVKYMIDKITGLDTKPELTNAMTTYVFFGGVVLSAIMMLNR